MNELQPASKLTRQQITKKEIPVSAMLSGHTKIYRNTILLINYKYPSVKPSIFSYLGNYLGFTGYYNPFSGEAQGEHDHSIICTSIHNLP
jgi:hypothetical protein